MVRSELENVWHMAKTKELTEFERGFQAGILAARHWHEAQSMQALVQSKRTRFPKNLEREAEVHTRSAEMMGTLSPEDV